MRITEVFKKIFIIFVICGVVLFGTASVYGASSSDLKRQLTQTNNRKNYIREKKRQTDLKLRREQNRLSTNQQKLEIAHAQLQSNTVRYNNLVSNLSSKNLPKDFPNS